MTETIRSEWIKVRTLTVNWVLVLCAAAFPIVITFLTALLSDDAVDGTDVAELVSGTSIVTAMLLGVVAAIGVTSEFTYNTIRPTFAATPRRMRPLVGKAIVHVGLSTAVMVLVVVVSWVVGSGLAEGSPSFDDESVKVALLGVILFGIGVTLLGFGLGLLMRNSAATLCVLLLWPFVIENLIAGLLSAAGIDRPYKLMPYLNGLLMASRESDEEFLGRFPGGLYFFSVAILIVLLGLLSANRRDA